MPVGAKRLHLRANFVVAVGPAEFVLFRVLDDIRQVVFDRLHVEIRPHLVHGVLGVGGQVFSVDEKHLVLVEASKLVDALNGETDRRGIEPEVNPTFDGLDAGGVLLVHLQLKLGVLLKLFLHTRKHPTNITDRNEEAGVREQLE